MKNNDQQAAFDALSFLTNGEYLGVRDFVQHLIDIASNLAYMEETTVRASVIFPNLHQSSEAALTFTSDTSLPDMLTEMVQTAARQGMAA